jgi:hypothetical protein
MSGEVKLLKPSRNRSVEIRHIPDAVDGALAVDRDFQQHSLSVLFRRSDFCGCFE